MSFKDLDYTASLLSAMAYEGVKAFEDAGIYSNITHIHGPVHGADAFIMEGPDRNWLVFRGTEARRNAYSIRDILTDLEIARRRVGNDHGNDFNLHSGFYEAWHEISDLVLQEVLKLAATQSGAGETVKPIAYTGHSLGAAMAGIAAATHKPMELITFGGPRFCGKAVGDHLSKTTFRRWVNASDVVPRVPFGFGYRHVGECHFIDADGVLTVNPSRWQLLKAFWGNYTKKYSDHAIREYQFGILLLD